MNRRGFLQAILAAGVAPFVITKAGVLMPGRGALILPDAGLVTSFAANPYAAKVWGQSLHRALSGKSIFFAMQALEMARRGERIAICAINPEPTRKLIKDLAGPQGIPETIIFRSGIK